MKQIITLFIIITITLNSNASGSTAVDEQKCNAAINQTAVYLRQQTALTDDKEEIRKFSRADVEQMIQISNRIIEQCEAIISHCDLNQEMNEGIVDLIIDNKDKVERLSSGDSM